NQAAARSADRILEQWLAANRRAQIVLILLLVPSAPRIADQLRRTTRVFVPGDRKVRTLDAMLGAQSFAARDQRCADLAARDRLGKQVDQILRHVAAVPGVDRARRLEPEPVGDAPGRIGRAAELGGE